MIDGITFDFAKGFQRIVLYILLGGYPVMKSQLTAALSRAPCFFLSVKAVSCFSVLQIYLVSDFQRVKLVFNLRPNAVEAIKGELVRCVVIWTVTVSLKTQKTAVALCALFALQCRIETDLSDTFQRKEKHTAVQKPGSSILVESPEK